MPTERTPPAPASQHQQGCGGETERHAPDEPECAGRPISGRSNAARERSKRERADDDGEHRDGNGQDARQPIADTPLRQEHQQQHCCCGQSERRGVGGVCAPCIQVVDRRVEEARAGGELAQPDDGNAAERYDRANHHRKGASFAPRRGDQEGQHRHQQRNTRSYARPLEQPVAHFFH